MKSIHPDHKPHGYLLGLESGRRSRRAIITRSLSITPGVWSNYNTDPRAETMRPGGFVVGVFSDEPATNLRGHCSLTWNLGKIEEWIMFDRWVNRNTYERLPFGLKLVFRARSGNFIIV